MILGNTLEYLSEALPVKGRALSLRRFFNQSLINSLNYLLEACDEVIPVDLFSKVHQNLNSLKPESKLSGLLSALHADLIKAIEQQDIQKILHIANILSKDNFQVEKMTYINFSSLNHYYTSLIKPIFSYEITRDVQFLSFSSQEFKNVKKSIEKGQKILKQFFPNFFKEFEEMTSEILILNAHGLRAGSSINLFGMIYKSYQYKWRKISDILEFLIHEPSHLYVFLLNKDDQLILNATEKHESPLREEKRPLMGIYHATFVLARVSYVLSKALLLNAIPENERDYSQELLADYRKRFFEGFKTLQTHAQMTPLGQALITSASKLV